MAKLRTELLSIRNALEAIVEGEDTFINTTDVLEVIDRVLNSSKPDSFRAFDLIEKSQQCIVATTNSQDDTIHVYGHTTDDFDAELAFGILARVRKNFKEEAMYMLFMKMMGGAYDND